MSEGVSFGKPPDPVPDSVILSWADALQIREALLTQVVWAPQRAVREVNEAIALADRCLGITSPLNPNGGAEVDHGE